MLVNATLPLSGFLNSYPVSSSSIFSSFLLILDSILSSRLKSLTVYTVIQVRIHSRINIPNIIISSTNHLTSTICSAWFTRAFRNGGSSTYIPPFTKLPRAIYSPPVPQSRSIQCILYYLLLYCENTMRTNMREIEHRYIKSTYSTVNHSKVTHVNVLYTRFYSPICRTLSPLDSKLPASRRTRILRWLNWANLQQVQ